MGSFIPGVQHGGVVLTGPDNPGEPGQLLASDGTGRLEFVPPGAGTVVSVNGHSGTVVLVADDLGAADTSHSHPQSDVTGLSSALSAKADLVGGKVPSSQIPAVAITEFLGAVSSQAAMLGLGGQTGDWCIRTDEQRAYFAIADDLSNPGNWQVVTTPSSPVTSVNGQTGTVVLGAADVSAPTTTAFNSHTANTANPHAVTKSQVGLGNVTNDAQLKAASNLSDLASAATARINLGVPQAPASNGAVEASKALVPDASKDLTGLRHLISETLTARQAGGIAGTDDLICSHDGTNGNLDCKSGDLNLGLTSTFVVHVGTSANASAIYLGSSTSAGMVGNGSSGIKLRAVAVDVVNLAAAAISVRSDCIRKWSSNTTVPGTADLGIGRAAAGVLEVNNGNSGTLAELAARAVRHQSFTIATLPTAGVPGRMSFASNARKAGEGAGAGTGVLVWDDGTNWRTLFDNSVAAA